MAKDVKIVKSKTAPADKNVLWDDGENLKINRNGKWENANNAETNNLGIDPVVWKYICNPLVITNGMECPQELLNNGKLKYKIPAMYVLLPLYNDSNNIYRVPTSYVYDNVIETFMTVGNLYYVATLSDGIFTVSESN